MDECIWLSSDKYKGRKFILDVGIRDKRPGAKAISFERWEGIS